MTTMNVVDVMEYVDDINNAFNEEQCYYNGMKRNCYAASEVSNHVNLHSDYFRVFVFTDLVVVACNVVFNSTFLLLRCRHRKEFSTPFFKMVTVLSTVIIFRTLLIYCSKIYLKVAGINNNSSLDKLLTNVQVLMVVDVTATYFAMVMVAVLSFNRLATFSFPKLNEMFFNKRRYVVPVVVAFCLAMFFTFVVTYFPKTSRLFIDTVGFVDQAHDTDLHSNINRVLFLLPFCSIFCYYRLYRRLRGQTIASSSNATRAGEQRIYAQMCIIVVAYIMQFLFWEVFVQSFLEPFWQFTLMMLITTVNSVPEMSIPLILVLSARSSRRMLLNVFLRRISSQGHAPHELGPVVRVPQPTSIVY